MKQITALALLTAALVMAWSANEALAGDAGKGKLIYTQKCGSCHGKEGKGDGPFGKNLTPPAASFADPAGTPRKSDAELLDKIAKGGKGTAMPAFKSLSPAEQADVLTYIRTLAK